MILSQINVGGPCKLNDNGSVIYFEDGVKLTTEVTLHDVGSDVGGPQDATKTDIVMKITGRPKSIWNATYRGVLLPAAYTNWTTAGGLLCGAANRAVSILGSDAHGYTFTRACLTKMPDVYLGLGAPQCSRHAPGARLINHQTID